MKKKKEFSLVHTIKQSFEDQDVSIILNTTGRRGRKAFENV